MRKILLLFILICTIAISWSFFKKPAQPDLTVAGFILESDGVGRQAPELIDAFRNEMTINFVPTRKQRNSEYPKRFRNLVENHTPKWGKVIVFEEILWWPTEEKYRTILKSDRDTSIRIAYSVWESTQIPKEWVLIFNKHFDAVAVASPFLVDVYKSSGVNIPVFVLPLGFHMDHLLQQPLKENAGQPFVFGNLSVCSERKNQIALIRAFTKAFGNDPNVQLRINCRHGEISAALTKEIVASGQDNIIFTQLVLPQDEYLDLFKSIDCYVSVSKGEGFSIQPREAMALGIPVIASNNTGQIPICASGLVKTISSPLKEIAIFPWGNSYGHYFNCTEEELATAMLDMKANYTTYLAMNVKAREWVKQYQYKNLQPLYRSLIKPKKLILGDRDEITPDYLMTSSKVLYDRYLKSYPNLL